MTFENLTVLPLSGELNSCIYLFSADGDVCGCVLVRKERGPSLRSSHPHGALSGISPLVVGN